MSFVWRNASSVDYHRGVLMIISQTAKAAIELDET
jgi:hypothetical protein